MSRNGTSKPARTLKAPPPGPTLPASTSLPDGDDTLSRVVRLLHIITLVQAGNACTPKSLAANLGITERSVYRYVKDLEAAGLPLEYSRKTGNYHLRAGVLLPPVQLEPDEALSLVLLCDQVAGKQQVDNLGPALRALAKIETLLPASVKEHIGQMRNRVSITTGPASAPGQSKSIYQTMRRAMTDKRVTRCKYESIDSVRRGLDESQTITPSLGPDSSFDFEPYELLFSVRAWYVVGYHKTKGQRRMLKLDRFVDARLTDDPYEIPADFKLETHLGHAWRMVRGSVDYDVEIWFDPSFAATMAETVWHRTQEIQEHDDGSATFRCRVSGLEEIKWWVLSMGPHCRVTQPLELAVEVKRLAAETAAVYSKKPSTAAPKRATKSK